jgi:hypothetical protein
MNDWFESAQSSGRGNFLANGLAMGNPTGLRCWRDGQRKFSLSSLLLTSPEGARP